MNVRFIATLLALVCAPGVASAQTEQIEYYGLDALGSVRVIFDAQGNTVDRMDYGPFGENLRAAIKFPVEQFAQLTRDPESGLDYAPARFYSAGTGRFNRVDPIYAGLFDPQKWNRYAYARNSPLVYTDPSGLDEDCPTTFCETVVAEDPGPESTYNFLEAWSDFVAWVESITRFGGGGGSGGGGGGGGGSSRAVVVVQTLEKVNDGIKSLDPRKDVFDCTQTPSALTCVAAVAGVLPGGKAGTVGVKTLFRTVSVGEMQSILKLGRYSVLPGGMEGKHFYPTLGQAAEFAQRNVLAGYGPQYLTTVRVSDELMSQGNQINVFGEGPVVFFPSAQLPTLGMPQVSSLPWFPEALKGGHPPDDPYPG